MARKSTPKGGPRAEAEIVETLPKWQEPKWRQKYQPTTSGPPRVPQILPAVPAPITPHFEIVHRSIVLSNRNDALSRRGVTGDVARLTDGRLICRYLTTMRDSTPAWAYAPWHPDLDPSERALEGPTDWSDVIRRKLETQPGYHQLGRDERSDEIARFVAQFPNIAADRRIEVPVGPARAFDPGAAHFPKHADKVGFPEDFWRSWLDRHAGGEDFGEHGRLDDAGELTQDVLWTLTIDSPPVLVQNKAAVAERAGAVRSLYALDDATCERWPKPLERWSSDVYGPRLRRDVHVLTAFLRRGPVTVLWIEVRGAHDKSG